MKIQNLPAKYEKIWKKCLLLIEKGRPGDDVHAKEIVEFILKYSGKLKFDLDILIPVAMMHDIGHSAILPEHFKYVTGSEKIENGKLVHMLAGAKIAQDILFNINYDKRATKEIVDIISMHDSDQLKISGWKRLYSTKNKKIFHDMDSLDRYNESRLKGATSRHWDRNHLVKMLEVVLDNFFYAEFRNIAADNLGRLKKL